MWLATNRGAKASKKKNLFLVLFLFLAYWCYCSHSVAHWACTMAMSRLANANQQRQKQKKIRWEKNDAFQLLWIDWREVGRRARTTPTNSLWIKCKLLLMFFGADVCAMCVCALGDWRVCHWRLWCKETSVVGWHREWQWRNLNLIRFRSASSISCTKAQCSSLPYLFTEVEIRKLEIE